MKSAILLHGTDGSDKDYFWFADTKKYLGKHGYEVWWPLLPSTDKPELGETIQFLEEHHNQLHWNKNMIIIGHSSACPLILTWLRYFQIQIKQVILISGFYQSIDDDGFSELMLPKEGFDWDAVKKAAKEITLINSDNDPWGCDDSQARPVAKKLNAKFILATGQGHMGSGSFDQPYRNFPLLKNLLKINGSHE
jgi:predicted alpha/beta hydrolase family esterase